MSLLIDEAHAIIVDAIDKGTKHPNYKRVTDLANLYLALITGDGIETLLKQFKLRETEEAFKQRVELTISTTDALSSSVMNPFEKVLRTDPLVKKVESRDKKHIEVIENRLMKFYSSQNQNSGLDYWFQTRFKSLSFLDPNAFIVIEWDRFDHRHEKATPYPYEVPSSQAINFKYVNNELQYLLDKKTIKYTEIENNEKVLKLGYKYTIYAVAFTIVYERVSDSYVADEGEAVWKSEKDEKYKVLYFDTNLDKIRVFNVGYLEDDATNGVTYVNPFHVAISHFKKAVRLDSEADLSKTLHAFPQKFQYVPPCPGDGEKRCISGHTTSGDTCSVCQGSGYIIHTSSQDAIVLPMPNRHEEAFDLEKMAVYKHPPIDLLKFQEEIIDKYEAKIHAAVFNTQAMVKKTIVATATEREQEMDGVYDALHPFAEKVSSCWSGFVASIAKIIDCNPDDLVIDFRYPNDFKLKSLSALINDLKIANESGAPSFLRAKLNNDIAEQTFVDQPEELIKYQVKQKFFPFIGKSPEEISLIMVQDYVPFRTKLIYANFDQLFVKAEKENIGFWDMKHESQQAIIDKYLDELEGELKPKVPIFNPAM